MQSVRTKKGDNGFTRLPFSELILKNDPRIVSIGEIDELTAAITLAICFSNNQMIKECLTEQRGHLMTIMGLLSLSVIKNHDILTKVRETAQTTAHRLPDNLISDTETTLVHFEGLLNFTERGWRVFDSNPAAAFINLSRTVCRRAERSIVTLKITHNHFDNEILTYMNALSDILFTLASLEEENAN